VLQFTPLKVFLYLVSFDESFNNALTTPEENPTSAFESITFATTALVIPEVEKSSVTSTIATSTELQAVSIETSAFLPTEDRDK
jgi:hypothetical protein